MNAIELLQGTRVVPVVVIEDVETAVPLAETLLENGLSAIEVTLRTPTALDAIAAISRDVPDMLVGAGSVRNTGQVASVVAAGARFGVGPGFGGALLESVQSAELPFIPGAMTPSESIALLDRGYTLQKFFPAGAAGGTGYLKSVAGPLPEVSFMPTGGINADNAPDYLSLPNVACIGGSWMVPSTTLRKRDFAAVARLAGEAAKL